MIPNVPLPTPACNCGITWASPTPRPVCAVHGRPVDLGITTLAAAFAKAQRVSTTYPRTQTPEVQ